MSERGGAHGLAAVILAAGAGRRLGGVAKALLPYRGCSYLQFAQVAQSSGGSVPWWCTATEEIPVTQGPAVGSVDYYAGTHKAPLTWDQCKTMSGLFDQAKASALQWPTEGAAQADGWRMATPYVEGMGLVVINYGARSKDWAWGLKLVRQ